MITQKRLKELLHYDSDTGIFTWLIPPRRRTKIGDIAGSLSPSGYVNLMIDYKQYKAHRLAWLYVHGKFPKKQLDHKDRIRHHNWIDNLRETTYSKNQFNRGKTKRNTSGYKGVFFLNNCSKFQARAVIRGKIHSLGLFDNPADAAQSYDDFAKLNHGEFYLGESLCQARAQTKQS